MGRRKIDIQYLQDDRVRKVTFCKRKGGLFKKADDLAKLCGVEVAVIIIQENDKLCTYASTMNDVDRVINRYKSLSSGVPQPESKIDELYRELEVRRRELEDAQRQLLQERKKVEAFVGQDVQMLTVRPVDMTQMNATQMPPQLTGVPQSQPWPTQQPHDSIPIAAPALMGSVPGVAAAGEAQQLSAGAAEEARGENEWHGEQPPPKRTKLDDAAAVVTVAAMQ